MSNQPLFAVCQLTRVAEFSVSTYLIEELGKRFIVKSPNNAKSKKHLADMAGAYTKLKESQPLVRLVTPVPAKLLSNGSIKLDFIEGRGAERLLVSSILEKRNYDAITIIDKLLAIIDSLPTTHQNPVENIKYSRVFGDAYNKNTICTTLGLIDLNLDNIIVKPNGDWSLIDYEWVFDFPVSLDYLKQRFFYWFFVLRYQDLLNYHSERIDLTAIAPGIFIPTFVFKQYGPMFSNLSDVISAESKLQEYVLGRKEQLATIKLFDAKQRDEASKQTPHVARFIDDVKAEIDTVRELLKHEVDKSEALQHELNNIQTSRTYRISKKISSAKTSISRRLK